MSRKFELTGQLLDVEKRTMRYRERVAEVIRHLADKGKFTAEDVRELAGSPEHHNAMGGLMRASVKAGVIKPVGYIKATREQSHSRPIAVYVRVLKPLKLN